MPDQPPFVAEFVASVNETLEDRLTREQRKKVARSLVNWLEIDAIKKPSERLPQQIKDFTDRIEKLAEDLKLELVDGKVVVKVNGSDEDTWACLRLGTNWFTGNDEILETVMAGVADESPL